MPKTVVKREKHRQESKQKVDEFRFAKHITPKNGAEIRREIAQIERELEDIKRRETELSPFIDKAKQYTEINELTAELLHLFIERVEVGERGEKWSRTAMQEINIYYRDIGLLDKVIEQTAEQDAQQTSTEVAAVFCLA